MRLARLFDARDKSHRFHLSFVCFVPRESNDRFVHTNFDYYVVQVERLPFHFPFDGNNPRISFVPLPPGALAARVELAIVCEWDFDNVAVMSS